MIVAVICQLPPASAPVLMVAGVFGSGPLGPPNVTAPVGLSVVLDDETLVSITAVTVTVVPRLKVLGVAVTVRVVALRTFTVRGAEVEEAKFESPLYWALSEWLPPEARVKLATSLRLGDIPF